MLTNMAVKFFAQDNNHNHLRADAQKANFPNILHIPPPPALTYLIQEHLRMRLSWERKQI